MFDDNDDEPIDFLDFLDEVEAGLAADPEPQDEPELEMPITGVPLSGKILVEFQLSINGYKKGDQAWLEAEKVQGLINQGMATLVTL